MLWPCSAPPAQNSCSCLGYRRTCELVRRIGCGCSASGSDIRPQRKKGCASKQEESAPAESCEVGDRGLLQSAQHRRRNNARAEFCQSRKGCAAVSFFCDTSLRDQLWVVAVPIEDIGDFVCGNFRRTVVRRVGGSCIQSTSIF